MCEGHGVTKIEDTFNDVMVCRGDVWVADYTEKTRALPKKDRRGVTIHLLHLISLSNASTYHWKVKYVRDES